MNKKSIDYRYAKTGEVTPRGWLKRQLEIQVEGLGGTLHTFWPDIKDSAWIGGSQDGWERVPYWLDGFIPLAYLLRNEELQQVASKYVEEIIARQAEDGWICPVPEDQRAGYDMWAYFLILKVLVVWHDATGEERVQGVVERALRCLDRHIDHNTLSAWGQTRWFEALVSIYWLHDRTGEEWLLELAVKLRAQGFDWVAFFEEWPMEKPLEYGRWSQMNHVVNQGMMLKSGPLYALISGTDRDRMAAVDMLRKLNTYHGMVTGIFTGDECLAGTSPVQGTELCAVVEMMYSLEWLTLLTGEGRWGDLLEQLTFNALPSTFSPDMKYHQYDQQVNQVQCVAHDPPVFLTNSSEGNLFGVEPNYGCCTANMHQGWPKFAQSLFMIGDRGMAVAAYAPARLETKWDGVPVAIDITTSYPFKDDITIQVSVERPVSFELKLRIPEWADPTLTVNGTTIECTPGGYVSMERMWNGNEVVSLLLSGRPELVPRPDGLAVLRRGALIYSIPIGEEWVKQEKSGTEETPWLNNYEVHATTPWNYGLSLDSESVKNLEFASDEPGKAPFSPEGAPVSVEVPVQRVEWSMERGCARSGPDGKPSGPTTTVRMIPYGCTNLRITEMPLAEKK